MSITILKTRRRSRRFLTYDLEWVPGTLEVRLVGVYDGNEYRAYSSVGAFIANELTHQNRGAWFFAHVGGLADYQFILYDIYEMMEGRGFRVRNHFSGSSVIIASVTRGKNAFHFMDSFWLFREKLENIGKYVGMVKGGGGFHEVADPYEEGIDDDEHVRRLHAKREWYKTVSIYRLMEYNERDCEILWTAVDQMQMALLEAGGQLQKTIASCAMQLFRRKYLTRNIETSSVINDIATEAYNASRVEVIEGYVWDANYFDLNSSFPYSMIGPCPGPYEMSMYGDIPLNGHPYMADVEVEVPETYLPTVPYRLDGRIFFPTGKWRAWMMSEDIELLAREGGRIHKVRDVHVFEPFYDLGAYVKDMYAKKKDATSEFERVVYKYLLNCLYGKFAEKNRKQSMDINPNEIGDEGWEMLMPGVWLHETIVPVPHAHVPISAHVTAASRRLIYDFMSSCSEVHYVDTDGFSTPDMLATGSNIGDLKYEKKVRRGRFVAAKVYSIEGEVWRNDKWEPTSYFKAKGFTRMTPARFNSILEGQSIFTERMRRVRELWRLGKTYPEEIEVEKKMKLRSLWDPDFNPREHTVPKRFTYPDGSTRPWTVGELKEMAA